MHVSRNSVHRLEFLITNAAGVAKGIQVLCHKVFSQVRLTPKSSVAQFTQVLGLAMTGGHVTL